MVLALLECLHFGSGSLLKHFCLTHCMLVILPLVDACLVLLFGMGESLIIRPQDKGPVPEMSDKVIDAILRDYLSMETRDKWFNFGPYNDIAKAWAVNGDGLVWNRTFANLFLDHQPSARVPIARFKKGVQRSLAQDDMKEWMAKEKITVLFPTFVVDRLGVVLDHLRKLARALAKGTDKDDIWGRTTRKMDEMNIKHLQALVRKIDLDTPTPMDVEDSPMDVADSPMTEDGWPDMKALENPLSQNSDAFSTDSSGWPKLLNESNGRDPLKREHSEISNLSLDSNGWAKVLDRRPSEADTIYYSENFADAESLAKAKKQAHEVAETPLPGKHAALGKIAQAHVRKRPAAGSMEIKSKSFGVIRLNSFPNGAKSYIRKKTLRHGKIFWASILNMQGPKHKEVARAIFSYLQKTKISKAALVKLKNKWMQDGVPDDKAIAEDEDDDDEHQEEEEEDNEDGRLFESSPSES